MTRGEIWWSNVPGVGRRPVLILTRDAAIALLGRVVVAPLTRNIRGLPTEVVVEDADGVPQRSAISLDNVQVLDKRRLVRRVTQLSESHMSEVCQALRFALAC